MPKASLEVTLDQKFISKYDADDDDFGEDDEDDEAGGDDGDDEDEDEDDCNIETMMTMKSCKTPTNVHHKCSEKNKCSPALGGH